MFENYNATKEDFEAIEEGIKTVWHPKLDFIFKDKSKIENTVVVSYDTSYIYLWFRGKSQKITHNLKIGKKLQIGWAAYLLSQDIRSVLPTEIRKKIESGTPVINGGLLGPFLSLQKQKKLPNNPYITEESYLATIIHEFGHVYYNQHNPDRLAKQDRLNLLIAALELYFHKTTLRQKPPTLYLPNPLNFSEIFAFCTEYTASNIFFKKHLKEVNKFDMEWIKTLIKQEEETSLSSDRITISLNEENNAHATATVFGKIILNFYPENWPQKLLQQYYL